MACVTTRIVVLVVIFQILLAAVLAVDTTANTTTDASTTTTDASTTITTTTTDASTTTTSTTTTTTDTSTATSTAAGSGSGTMSSSGNTISSSSSGSVTSSGSSSGTNSESSEYSSSSETDNSCFSQACLPLNSPCHNWYDSCAATQYCDTTTQQCMYELHLGEPCDDSSIDKQCGWENRCKPPASGTGPSTCQPIDHPDKWPGSVCVSNDECLLNTNNGSVRLCNNGTCFGYSEGMPCNQGFFSQCYPDLFCNGNFTEGSAVCTKRLENGAYCEAHDECISYFCAIVGKDVGRCTTKYSIDEGFECMEHDECVEGLYCNATHLTPNGGFCKQMATPLVYNLCHDDNDCVTGMACGCQITSPDRHCYPLGQPLGLSAAYYLFSECAQQENCIDDACYFRKCYWETCNYISRVAGPLNWNSNLTLFACQFPDFIVKAYHQCVFTPQPTLYPLPTDAPTPPSPTKTPTTMPTPSPQKPDANVDLEHKLMAQNGAIIALSIVLGIFVLLVIFGLVVINQTGRLFGFRVTRASAGRSSYIAFADE